jgi:hypothetical protein
MLEFKTYFYYIKKDPSKEAMDRVVAPSEEQAVIYFTDRKKMKKEVFMNLYNVEVYEKTKSE